MVVGVTHADHLMPLEPLRPEGSHQLSNLLKFDANGHFLALRSSTNEGEIAKVEAIKSDRQ